MQNTTHHTSRRHHWRTLLVFPTVLALAIGCTTNGDSVTQPKNNITTLPWRLNLDHKAIIASVGEAIQLHATPISSDGTELSGLPPIVWTTSDTSVLVDETGKVTAHSARSNIFVYAKIQSLEGNWTVADTARITVFDHPFPFSSFKMVLDGPAVIGVGDWRNFDTELFDASGNPLRNIDVDPTETGSDSADSYLPITYYTPSVGRDVWAQGNLWNGGANANNYAKFSVKATSLIFGKLYHDSVEFTSTWPDSGVLYIYRVSYNMTPSPSMMSQTDLTIIQGGVVNFYNQNTTQAVDIVFDDQANVVGGNIPSVPGYPGQYVHFPNAGKFTYHSSLGFNGTITVLDANTPPPIK